MIERIASPSRTKEIIDKNNFYFKKSFGQNFLIDSNILENIVAAAGVTQDDCVLEIGPGIGSLTQVLAENSKKVIAIEIDRNLVRILKDTLKDYDNIEIINTDVLKADIDEIIDSNNDGNAVKVVANLPYYITTPIIMDLLEKKANIKSITVMVQKEVAERMQSKAGRKEYGALSLAVGYYAEAEINLIVQPSCFMPSPKVSSAVITLNILDKPSVDVINQDMFFKIIKCAFGQRRKTLLNSIFNQGEFGLTKEELGTIIRELGLDERVRGEALNIVEFGMIADKIYEFTNKELITE